ncbi:hypothetical protein ABTB15_19365, partial [Acinetobacter baumannii]
MFAGISGRVAFKAEDQFGHPVYVKGAIKNKNNQLIDSFAAVHDGMGSVEFEPKENETYYAEWLDEYGNKHTDFLPT